MAASSFWKETARPPLADPVHEGTHWGTQTRLSCDLSSDQGLLEAASGASVTVEVDELDDYYGPEAYLLPQATGGFRLVVADPSVYRINRPTARNVPNGAAVGFLVAHELGHLFFYDRHHTPARRTRIPSDGEEAFCDEFALALLGLEG